MIKSRYNCSVLIVIILTMNNFDSIESKCTQEFQKKLESAIKEKKLPSLFVLEANKVYTDKFINGKEKINNEAYKNFEALLDCAHDYLKKNEEEILNIDIDEYVDFMNEFNDILKNNIKDLKGRLAREVHIKKKLNQLWNYNKQAYINIMIGDIAQGVQESVKKNRNFNFDKFYKDGGYAALFKVYDTFVNERENQIKINEYGVLSPESYYDITNLMLLTARATANQMNIPQQRFALVYSFYKYYYVFLINATREINSLEKKLSSIFTLNKKAIRLKIETLEKQILVVRNILKALLITDLYVNFPVDFYKKINESDPGNAIIFSETEAFLIIYKKITT